MISTSYTALSNQGSNTNLQTYSIDKNGQAGATTHSETNNTSTYTKSGVILTLSEQAISAGLASGVVRTLASTSGSSILKVGSRGNAVTELQKNLTKLG